MWEFQVSEFQGFKVEKITITLICGLAKKDQRASGGIFAGRSFDLFKAFLLLFSPVKKVEEETIKR